MSTIRRIANAIVGPSHKIHEPFAIQRKADITNPTARTAVYRQGEPVTTTWTASKAISDGLKASSWVYTCISMIAENAASVPWFGMVKGRDGEYVTDKTSRLSVFLETMNPKVGRKMVIETWMQHLLLTGNSMSWIIRVTDTRTGLKVPKYVWPLSPDDAKPVPDENGYIVFYKTSESFKQRTKIAKIPVEDMLHFMLTNPASLYWGLSPMEAAANSIDTDADAVKWNRYAFQNRAQPPGILQIEDGPDDDQYDEIMAQMAAYYMGAENARTPFILEASNAKWIPTSNSPLDMDFMNGRRFTREEVASIFKVHPVLLGAMDASTYNNVSEAIKQLWSRAIMPILDGIEIALDIQLAPQFGPDQRVTYTTNGIPAMVQMTIGLLESIKLMWGMGVPYNVAIKDLNASLSEIPGGEIGYIPANMISVSEANQGIDGNGNVL